MKILYVSQYFPPEMGAPAARVSELARHWTRAGHEVTVLTGFPNHPNGVVTPEYRSRFRRLACKEEVEGVRVVRTWLLPLPNRKPHERILNYVSFCISAAISGTFVSKPDVVIATSPQLLVGLAGAWIATRYRVPLIFEVRDLWPESMSAVGIGRQTSFMNRTLGTVADFLYARAERVVVVTPAFRDHLIGRRNVDPAKIAVVENGVETDFFRPATTSHDVKRQLGIDGRFVIGYIGTIGLAHGLETLLDAAASLRSIAPDVLFLIVGDGAEAERLRQQAKARELLNVVFAGQQPREAIPAFINACDACLVMLRKSEVFQTVIPTKMLECMSSGRPVLLGVDGQARGIVEQADAGIFFEPENAAALINTLLRLRRDSIWKERLGKNGRQHILALYSRARTAASYLSVLDDVLANSKSKAEACNRSGVTALGT